MASAPVPGGRLRIAVVGSSVAAGQGARRTDEGWAYLLAASVCSTSLPLSEPPRVTRGRAVCASAFARARVLSRVCACVRPVCTRLCALCARGARVLLWHPACLPGERGCDGNADATQPPPQCHGKRPPPFAGRDVHRRPRSPAAPMWSTMPSAGRSHASRCTASRTWRRRRGESAPAAPECVCWTRHATPCAKYSELGSHSGARRVWWSPPRCRGDQDCARGPSVGPPPKPRGASLVPCPSRARDRVCAIAFAPLTMAP